MRVEMNTKGFERTESMETFLQEQANDFADTYLKHDRDVHIRFAVDEDSHRSQARKPHFLCELQIKTAGSKKYFKTHKTSDDFRAAVLGAVKAMKVILQKRSDRRHDMKASRAKGISAA